MQHIINMTNQPSVTMSSRDIAELCEKRHDHVIRDIEKTLTGLKFGVSEFASTYKDITGRNLKEYRLPKDLTMTVVSGYSVDLRYRIIKKLEAMEAAIGQTGGFYIPKTLPDALRLAADLADENKQLQTKVADMSADVSALERISKADGSYCITDAAKNLGIRPSDLFLWLSANGWTFKRKHHAGWLGYQSKAVMGLLEHKTTTVTKADGSEKITEQVRITARGLAHLAKVIPQLCEAVA